MWWKRIEVGAYQYSCAPGIPVRLGSLVIGHLLMTCVLLEPKADILQAA
jgi:hypothetical protein